MIGTTCTATWSTPRPCTRLPAVQSGPSTVHSCTVSGVRRPLWSPSCISRLAPRPQLLLWCYCTRYAYVRVCACPVWLTMHIFKGVCANVHGLCVQVHVCMAVHITVHAQACMPAHVRASEPAPARVCVKSKRREALPGDEKGKSIKQLQSHVWCSSTSLQCVYRLQRGHIGFRRV